MSTPRKTSMIEYPNQPRFLNTVAHGHTKSNSMSKMMKKMAMVENLMAKRPSGRATGSLPHSNGSILIREGRRGAMRAGIPRRAPPTRAETSNSINDTATTNIYTLSLHDALHVSDALGLEIV